MRKWTYLVATLLMAGTTATFTGCIDTDEPEGIAELRGAKSDFIKAQAAVELVEAELRKAQVAEQELVNAGLALQNKSAEIDLQLHELDIQLKQLLIEKEEAIIRVPHTLNKESFYDGNIVIGEAKLSYLLPLKILFFKYFSVLDLLTPLSNGKSMLEMQTVAGGSVRVVLRIPIVGNATVSYI